MRGCDRLLRARLSARLLKPGRERHLLAAGRSARDLEPAWAAAEVASQVLRRRSIPLVRLLLARPRRPVVPPPAQLFRKVVELEPARVFVRVDVPLSAP